VSKALPWRGKKKARKGGAWGDPQGLANAISALGVEGVSVSEPMSRHTTMKVGGPADAFVRPKTIEEVQSIQEMARTLKAPVTPIGNGSNLVVRDGGLEGIALSLKGLTELEVLDADTGLIRVGAGVPMNRLIRLGLERGFEGIWYLTGIPGSVGGALWMNAGTRHGDISQVVREVTVMTAKGRIKTYQRDALDFEYRSLNLDKGTIILGGVLELSKADDPVEIKRRHREVLDYRTLTQPLQKPACGSVFRNPPGDAAGRLIEKAGLKGVRVRGAQVSEMHANWIINAGEATASDVILLMKLMFERVKEGSHVSLIPEVEVVGVDL